MVASPHPLAALVDTPEGKYSMSGPGAYKDVRNDNGELLGVHRIADNSLLPIDGSNSDYQAFLAWNKGQEKPVAVSRWIIPGRHHLFRSVQELADHCKERGVMLFNNRAIGASPALGSEFN